MFYQRSLTFNKTLRLKGGNIRPRRGPDREKTLTACTGIASQGQARGRLAISGGQNELQWEVFVPEENTGLHSLGHLSRLIDP